MSDPQPSRRGVISHAAMGAVALPFLGAMPARAADQGSGCCSKKEDDKKGDQRLSLARLKAWEELGYGMFIHYGMSTFDGNELSDGKSLAGLYAPTALDVEQWVSVARDAGMKYAVLTAKHVAGHCLWPTRYTAYSVANSTDKTDVCEKFVQACEKRGVKPGFYYCSYDNHNRFGSVTPSDPGIAWGSWAKYNFNQSAITEPPAPNKCVQVYTTSVYQGFQTAQITELLTQYGPIAEIWVDIPGMLGAGYRRFLYERIAELQPQTVIMMNNGIGDGANYDYEYAWPGDLIAIERGLPPERGHRKWREYQGKRYYMPGELCDPIGKEWFWVPGDEPRSDESLLKQFQACRQRGANVLLDVPPDTRGLIPDSHIQALMRLRKNAGI